MELQTPFSKLKNPTGLLKDWYQPGFIKIFCEQINPGQELFDSKVFIGEYKKSYKNLEFKDRHHLIASLIHKYLQFSYVKQIKTLERLLYKPLPYEEGMFDYGFHLFPVSQFVENYGFEHLETSLNFIKKMTVRFTGEFAIRPLANRYERDILRTMNEWSTHRNFHIRRLASEGLRPRLPWGTKIEWVNSTPKKVLPIYNRLRNDPILYVRRSVANSIGDIIKIDEDLAIKTLNSWLKKKKTAENLWVIKHAIRNPVKKKNQRFLEISQEVKSHLSQIS